MRHLLHLLTCFCKGPLKECPNVEVNTFTAIFLCIFIGVLFRSVYVKLYVFVVFRSPQRGSELLGIPPHRDGLRKRLKM